MSELYDVAIIGAGAGGLTTAIYASRSGLKVALIEKGLYGGQLNNTESIENYTGFEAVSGFELAQKMENHARSFDGIDHIFGNVIGISDKNGIKSVELKDKSIISKTVVIATGVKHKTLNIGEEEYEGRGVSYCAVCDGAFFKGKDVAVIGGGDSAVESALYLSKVANSVTLVHRRNELKAEKINQLELFSKSNVDFIWNANTLEIHGNDKEGVKAISFAPADRKDGEVKSIDVDGVFVNIGITPVTDSFNLSGMIKDTEGYIVTDSKMETLLSGLFAVGDVRRDSIRQVVSATGDGAIAADSISKYIQSNSEKFNV